MPLMSNVMCPRAEVRLVLAEAAVAVLPVQLGGTIIARRANGPCFMAVPSFCRLQSKRKVGAPRWQLLGVRSRTEPSASPSLLVGRVCSSKGAGAVAVQPACSSVLRRRRSSQVCGAPALARSGKCSRRSGVAAAEQAPAYRPVLVGSEHLPPLQNASMRRPTHNHSIERTRPGKPGRAAHVERYAPA